MSIDEKFLQSLRVDGAVARPDAAFQALTDDWSQASIRNGYVQHFTWLDRPVVQVPQDIYAIQEIIWRVKPDLIIETGIAHGGSLVLSASMLALLDYVEAATQGKTLTPGQSSRRVLGVDIEIRPHNREALEAHPLFGLIDMIEGSSVDPDVVQRIKSQVSPDATTLVFLDSNHTHQHVLEELIAYAPMVSPGSYCVVWDSGLEDLPDGFVTDRPWGRGDNPKTALAQYLQDIADAPVNGLDGTPLRFEIDKELESKLAITAVSDGFLRRVT